MGDQKPGFVHTAISNWKNYYPNELSKLFYIQTEDGLKRVNKYILDLTPEDKLSIESLNASNVHAVKIGMGCVNDLFSPIFCIITGAAPNFEYFYFRMQLNPQSQLGNLPKSSENTSIIGNITEGTAQLFIQSWSELNENELRDAFSGSTINSIKQVDGLQDGSAQIQHLRVNFYTFGGTETAEGNQNAIKIVELLQVNLNQSNNGLYLWMGAGLPIQFSHPFNFRPILELGNETDHGSIFFERTLPCPPFCNTAGF